MEPTCLEKYFHYCLCLKNMWVSYDQLLVIFSNKQKVSPLITGLTDLSKLRDLACRTVIYDRYFEASKQLLGREEIIIILIQSLYQEFYKYAFIGNHCHGTAGHSLSAGKSV